MTIHAIRPAQLRALLLLLALVPLVPTVLLFRFTHYVDASERALARPQAEYRYQQILLHAAKVLRAEIEAPGMAAAAEDVFRYYEKRLAPEAVVGIVDADGRVVAGTVPRGQHPLAQMSLQAIHRPWNVLVFGKETEEGLSSLTQGYSRGVAILALAILATAGAAGYAIHRELRLRDLKSTAVATIAHELRTPLASIRMLVDTLREGRYRTQEQSREYLELVASEIERLSRITDQFLTHSRLEHGKHGFRFHPSSPVEIAEAAVELLRPRLYASDCKFTFQTSPELPTVHADGAAMTTVLVNLLENALKYTDAGKGITLRVRGASEAVIFEVMDNGIGLTKSEARDIFRPFHQADQRLSRSREGCGLGLSIVRQIVEAHGGTVTVESRIARGSCFTVRLPVRPADDPGADGGPARPSPVGEPHPESVA